jgi:asparagine synthase (glutamine-hydrolysing)
MQRWVGSDWSASSQERVVLAPFFSPAFITWALNARPSLKRHSRLLAQVLDAIDPELARLPLASGKAPTSMFAPGISDRIAGWTETAHKVAVKVRQRVKESAKPPAGAGALSRLALAGLRDQPAALERVAALPFVCGEYVERLADGAPASPATVGLLVGLSGLADDINSRAGLAPELAARSLAIVRD